MNDEKNMIGWVKYWTPKDDWYYLSEEEREKYINQYNQIVEKTKESGADLIGVYKCRGQSSWMRFEFWEFPAVEDIIEFTNQLEEIGHYQFFEEDHTVGRKYQRNTQKDSWVV